MARPAIDFDTRIRRIPQHVADMPAEASVPVLHYVRSVNDAVNLLAYAERNLARADVYRAALDRHLQTLRVMVLLSLAEAFERLLKELAAVCIDQIAPCVLDDRLDVFTVKGEALASNFGGGTLGRALCESFTWCDCDETNKRFRRILADAYEPGDFYVFPKGNQQPAPLRDRYDLMGIIWQMRHAIVHNRGVLTASDAQRLRVLCKAPVAGPNRLNPTSGDVWYVRLFLDETAELLNREVGLRLAALLTTLHVADPTLFDPAAKARELADLFRQSTTVAGHVAVPTPT